MWIKNQGDPKKAAQDLNECVIFTENFPKLLYSLSKATTEGRE